MDAKEYLTMLNFHLSQLYAFARQMNELDFAASLSGEFRGAQDAGWNTTITAHEVFEEFSQYVAPNRQLSKHELRVVLMLYCQLAEAGGVYETLKNMLGVITLKPYLMWPFKNLVRVKQTPKRVIGPNANATLRDLAINAKEVGLIKLSELIEASFRDDIRNGISHADYVIWDDGLRLRKRNGGNPKKLSFAELNDAVTKGIGFFQILVEHNTAAARSFDPPKTIVGRLSESPPMPWTVSFDAQTGAFAISGSSPGPVKTSKYNRQVTINGLLGGKVLATYSAGEAPAGQSIDAHISASGFEPTPVVMAVDQFASLRRKVESEGLWDERQPRGEDGDILLASPWGFTWLRTTEDFGQVLNKPLVEINIGHGDEPRNT